MDVGESCCRSLAHAAEKVMQDYNALQRDKALLASLFSRLCHFFVVFFYFVTAGKKLSFEGTLL